MPGIQRDFGGFDSKFLGVSVKIETQRFFEILNGLVTTGEIEPGLAWVGSDPEERFEAISAASVLAHELRHFHDFLIAPSGTAILALRVMAYLNAMQFLSTIPHASMWGDANCLPIPLSTWCTKTPEERDAFITRLNAWRDPRPPLVAPDLPYIRLDADPPQQRTFAVAEPYSIGTAAELLRATAWQYRRLGDLLAPPMAHTLDRPFLPMHVSELSAILVQLQEVWGVLGEDAAGVLLTHLSNVPAMRYSLPLQMFSVLTEEAVSIDLLSAVATWSLCGAWPHGGDRESPVVRFSELALFLTKNGWPDSDTPVVELYAAWDADLGREPTIEALHASLGRADAFLDRLAQRQSELQPRSAQLLEEAIRFFEMFASARTHCVECFCAAPDEYVRPRSYLDAGSERLTAPPVVYEFTGPFGPEAASWETAGFRVYLARETAGGQQVARIVRAPLSVRGKQHLDEDLAFKFLTFFTMTDVLFSPLRWDPEDAELDQARQLLGGLAHEDRPLIRLLR